MTLLNFYGYNQILGKKKVVLFFILCHLFSNMTFAQEIEKININKQDPYENSSQSGFVKSGSAVVFVSTTCEHGTELWRYKDGELKLFDLFPGMESSDAGWLTEINNYVYFKADTGTPLGNVLCIYNPVLDSAYVISPPGWGSPNNFTEHESKLYCKLGNIADGNQIWEFNGDSGMQISDNQVSVSLNESVSSPVGLFYTGGNSSGVELWKYDGTSSSMIADINVGTNSSIPSKYIVVGDTVYFAADDGIHFKELWKYDGTGAYLVQDINPVGHGNIAELYTDGTRLFFSAYDPVVGTEPRVIENGVLTTYDINPGFASSTPTSFILFDGNVYFSATDATNGKEVWKYEDGTVSLLADINPGSASSNPATLNKSVIEGGYMYFRATTASYGTDIWKTDGITTTMEADFTESSSISQIFFNGTDFLFTALTVTGEFELWKYDGLSYQVVTINPDNGSSPGGLVIINDTLYLGASNGFDGIEPHFYDGISSTFMGNTDSSSAGLIVTPNSRFDTLNNELYFITEMPPYDKNYWHFTDTGSYMVTDTNLTYYQYSIAYNDGTETSIVFEASESVYGEEVWGFDGTQVYLIEDIFPGPGHSTPEWFIEYNGDIYFAATDPVVGRELMKFDGTSVTLAADIDPAGGSSPLPGMVYNGELYFRAVTGPLGGELWKFDGSNAYLVSDIYSGVNSSNPHLKYIYNGELYFSATDDGIGRELYKFDGTDVTLVADINSGAGDSDPANFIEYNGTLFFTANDGVLGNELWSYNPADGCVFVADLNPGSSNSYLFNPRIFNGKLVFGATTGSHTYLMEMNGASLYIAGSLSNFPAHLAIGHTWGELDGNLYVTYQLSLLEYELWRYNGYNLTKVGFSNTPGAHSVGASFLFNGALYGGGDFYCDGKEIARIGPSGCVPQVQTNVQSACDQYTFEGELLTSSGLYYITYPSVSNCDSIIELDLTIHESSFNSFNESACSSYIFYDDTIITNGTYQHFFVDQFGCDSVETLNLIINQPQETDQYVAGCDSVVHDGITYFVSGAYPLLYTDINGCDSLVNLEVTVYLGNPTISQIGNVLYASPAIIGTYQWIDCQGGGAQISGANNDSFSPDANGSYAVIIELNGCPDTSDCFDYLIDDTGIKEDGLNFNIYSPSAGNILITSTLTGFKSVRVYNSNGDLVAVKEFNGTQLLFGLDDFSTGVYSVVILHEGITYTQRLLLQRF